MFFTLNKVQFGWRKICLEFSKRMNPSLPYYYHTSTHDRFYEGERPDFNIPPKKKKAAKRTRRREQPSAMVGKRVTMAVNQSCSIRAEFHNKPVDLPPPTNHSILEYEHAYHKKH